jgi:phosphatidylserine/phosphatidylglycerophosphate/cardiolipin synthase-like enzyme
MSSSASGRVINENGAGIAGLGVHLEDISQVLVVSLAKGTTNSSGNFSLTYPENLSSNEPGKQVRQLRLRILVGLHPIKEVVRADTTQPAITFETIQRTVAEATSWWATLGTGAPSRLSHSNAIRWLVDNVDAWGHTQDVISRAQTLDIMQLSIAIDEFSPNLHTEIPHIILRFDPNKPFDSSHRRNINDNDKRIERSILERVQKGVEVRIQVPRMSVDVEAAGKVLGITLAGAITGVSALLMLGGVLAVVLVVLGAIVVLLGLATLGGLLYAAIDIFPDMFNKKRLARWFERAIADLQAGSSSSPPATGLGKVRVSELKLRSNNVTHAKLVIDRGVEAVVLGSPFGQVYFGDTQHVFDDPRRGGSPSKGPIHEMSVAVRGGAVGYLEEVFNNHWNIAAPDDKLLVTPPIPSAPTSLKDGEFLASVQVVRTFDKMFAPATDGEQGVLESYLRAIHLAERFIYIENQYFNNDMITEALVAALKRKPALQLILLVNAAPDMPLYMGWQQKAIKRILGSLGDVATAAKRVGVFSTWVHASKESLGESKPAIVDIYLHTKSALIDNRWATVGSANLDGASLDYIQYARAFFDSDVRNTEANLVVFEDTGTIVSAVDALRRKLWAEHLGFTNPADPELNDAPGKDWVAKWRERAAAKLTALKADFNSVHPAHIFEWPADDFFSSVCITSRHKEHITATEYLQSLLKPKDVPKEIVPEGGPGGLPFTYGTFPRTDVPGSSRVAPTAGNAAISDEETATT